VERTRFVAVGDLFLDVAVHGGPGHAAQASVHAGGTAANTAVWAASLGAHATVVGRLGYDLAGGAVRAAVESRGVHVTTATDLERPTGTLVLLGGEPYVDRGANAALAPADLPESIEADVVALSPYLDQETALAVVDRSRARWIAALGRPVTGANAVILSEAETAEGVHELASRFRLACVTLGALGAIAVLDGHEASAPAPAVQTADPSGAGDAFAAALLCSLASDTDLADALAIACRCGADAAASPTGWPVIQ
jgi:sugar/nucleoside kinase (ribokinase family)